MSDVAVYSRPLRLAATLLACGFLFTVAEPVCAGIMTNDPEGFYGLPWGASLQERDDFTRVETGERIESYELKQGPPRLGNAVIDLLRFVTIDAQFARATLRYHGTENHRKLLAHLENLYGPVERLPGSMMRGLNQQFNWRGSSTEVNMTYDGGSERGHVFIESRTLAPRFNDTLPEHAF